MTKRSLEIFVTVCESQSMTAAAKQLELTQPAVSAAVRELEDSYETKLFERHGRTVVPTEAGRRLRQYADTILDQYRCAWNSLHEEGITEEYHIGISSVASETFLPLLAGNILSRKFPFSLSYTVSHPDTIAEMLKEHQTDLCIMDRGAEESGWTYIPLYKEEFCAAASDRYTKEDTLRAADLSAHRLLLREKGCGSRECLSAAVQKTSISLKPYAEADSDLCLIKMAESGIGIVIAARELIEKSLKKKRLHEIRIKGADMKRQYYLVYRSDMHMSENFSALCEMIRKSASQK